jgi:protein involved in polysaccharide export with SLBB domain
LAGGAAGFESRGRLAGDAEKDEEEGSPVEYERPRAAEVLPEPLEGPIDPHSYVLGPADELLLILRGPQTQMHRLTVLPEGNVILPNVGTFSAAGMTLAEFSERARSSLKRFYRNIEVDCQLSIPRRFLIFVLGEVNAPGPVQLAAPFRLSHAVRAAGEVTSTGSMREIQIRENGQTIDTVDLFTFLKLGDFDHNPMLKENQSVFVPLARFKAQILGDVMKPGIYEMVQGETVANLLRFAGGFTSRGDQTRMLIERVKVSDDVSIREFPAALAHTVELEDMDLVVVRNVLSYDGAKPVQVVGGGGRVGSIHVRKREMLRDFLFRLWRFTDDFETESAILERHSRNDEPRHVTFDVASVLHGDPVGETVVQPGDMITFPPVERNVYVTGEVVEPGKIPFLPGLPAEKYIGLAGGPSEAGSFDRLSIFSRDGIERTAGRNSPVYRGETIVVKRKTSKTLGSLFLGLASVTGVLLSVIALTK